MNPNEDLKDKASLFERVSTAIINFSATSAMFAIAVILILVWLITGPIFGYSNTWLLIVNTGTSIITFLMVFLIQRSQNKESIAVQLKLNELIAANNSASNRLLNIQDLSENELNTLYEHYRKLVELTQQGKSSTQSHSVEEAISVNEELDAAKRQEEAKESKE